MSRPLLIGDIGGTNARFAIADPSGNSFIEEKTFKCADFPTPEDAIRQYLAQIDADSPEVICFAVAGPIVDHSVSFTNNPWQISAANLRATFRCEKACLLNDFEAVAWSITALKREDKRLIGSHTLSDLSAGDFSVCVMGPGTGLGAAGLMRRDGVTMPVITEAGHVGFAPEDDRQAEVLILLREKFGRVSDERLVSGMGIRNLYWALSRIHGNGEAKLSEAEVFERSREDEIAAEAVQLFFEVLGQACGNLVLSLGAFDGAYVAGGIAQRHAEALVRSSFRRGFDNKGRHQRLMAAVPTALIVHPQPGLLGSAQVAQQQAAS